MKRRNYVATLCYMDIDRFIAQVKTEDIYKEIASNVEKIMS